MKTLLDVGADPGSIGIADLEDIALAYLLRNAVRFKVKVAGALRRLPG